MARLLKALLAALLFAGCMMDPDAAGKLVPKTVDEDPALPQIAVNGTRLHAEAFGDPSKTMIMVLHGGPGGDYRYLLPMRALADDGYYVVFWDQRGTGLSQRHDPSSYQALPLYLEDLRQVIERFSSSSTQPIVFLGQSWGAMYATWFINEYGDYGGRIQGAILSEPGAFTSKSLEAYMKRSFPPYSFVSEELNDVVWSDQLISKASHARADYLLQVAVMPGAPREGNDPSIPIPTWRKGAIVYARLGPLALDQGFDWTTNLSAFPYKVLFLRGERNENLPLDDQQEKASHYPRSEIITIAGSGHDAAYTHHTEFLQHARDYLAEVAPIGGGR